MQMKLTRNLKKAIVNFETFQSLDWMSTAERPKEILVITGDDARHQMSFLGVKTSNLIDDCLYVFRYSRDEKKLVPKRMSMHPKTYANYSKGWKRFGAESILREL